MRLAGRLLRPTILAAVAVLELALLARVALTSTLDASPCGAVPPTTGPVPPVVYAVVAVAAFLVGGLFGLARRRPEPEDSDDVPRADVAIQAALTAFLLVVAAGLLYETYALATPGVWPLTFYVRCANLVAPAWTLLGMASSVFLLGHWLWRPLLRVG